VQNILVLRFANGMFEPIWNRHHIDHVQIIVDEKRGVGQRARFYDLTGALCDMVPNHLFQLLSLIAMERPAPFNAHNVRSEKNEVLTAIQIQSEEEALKNSVRGQYTAGKIGETEIPDYRKNPDVRPDSTTETYVAMKLKIDNWRWVGVPFYLRTGKALAMKRTKRRSNSAKRHLRCFSARRSSTWPAASRCLEKSVCKGLEFYPAGSKGPSGAHELLKRDGRRWRKL
jgi:glucose-6-phosphate 1-dehydrogenase